jgi:hypothetical protein
MCAEYAKLEMEAVDTTALYNFGDGGREFSARWMF